MNIHDLLNECVRSGIRLAENNGDLRVHFDGPTPDRALLDLLRRHKQDILQQLAKSETRHVAGIPALAPETRTSAPASTAQRRMWLLHMLEEANGAYNMVGVYRVRGSFDAAHMQAALDTLVARHEALRTVFAEEDGEVRQCVQPTGRVAFEHLDLSMATSDEAEHSLQRLLQRENRWRFDLAAGPLLRATCSDLGNGNWMLLLNIHHIAGDEWSIGILEHEISALYTALSAGTPPALLAPTLHYIDYAAWSNQQAEGSEQLAQLDYWKAKLAGLPALHSLPLDKPRPAVQVYDGGTVRRILPQRWLQAAQTLCQASNATLFMYLHAALTTVLSAYSNEDDITLGFPVSGRQRKELETVVGLFVNTLVLRVPMRGDMTFADALALSREAVIEALQHRDVPFDTLVDTLCSGRSPAYTPLVQIFLALQTQERAGLRLPGIDVEALDNPGAPVKFDLQVDAVASDAGLIVDWRFNRSLFEDASMERMADALVRVLEASVHAPDQPLSRIDLLAPQERQLLLETWNQTTAPYPDDRCLHQLFEEQVQRSPHATALVLDTHTLSYAALNAQANQLAHHLIAQGLRPDGLVALCVQRSFAMVVGLLAILKAGGAYVPLDPDYPAARLQQILDDADPALLLVDAAGRIALGDGALPGRHVLDLDHPHPAWHQQPQTDPDPHALGLHARHLAYVIYTSGSTGTPKGAQNEHRALVNRLVWMQQAYRLDARDVVVQKTPFGFDVSVWEFFWPLLNGATLALAPPGAHKDPDALAALFVHHGVTTAHFVPSMLALFLQTPGVERCTTLRHLVCSGEALPASSVRLAQRRLPWTALHNLYGPTEAAIDVTAWTCPPAFAGESVPIGRPIANTTIYLLDGNGQPVPLGAVGELHIGGVGVARGYLNRPQLTTERFLPDPFAADPEARLYRTGDLARYRADGAIEFLGRIDHQVKLRGFRIELGEIEARIAEHPAVHSTVVLALGEAAHMRLVAYVVPRETPADALVTTLRTFLARTLPDYMVPAAFVCLPALPLSANGKLDRKALPAPQDDAFARHAYAPPHPGTEAILAEAWCRLLGRERIGRHDQFFALGGNSLLAVRLLSRIEAACGVRLSLAEVFAHPTLRELAHAVTRHQSGAATASLPAIVPVHHGDTLPLSFAQQRLWFLAQLEGTGTAYHMPGALRLRGDLDPLALRRALDALLQRHAALRTVFATSADGQPLAHLLPAGQAFPLVEHDLGLQPDQAAAIARLALDEVLAPFDLARGPLIRGRLLRLGQADHVLLITQHHIVSDGWSLGILINELGALYRAMVAGQPDPLPPLAVQYPDYAAWQRRWFTAERLGKQLDYWSRCLADAPVLLTLPTDRPRPATPSHAGASVPIALDATLTRALKRLGQQHQTTLFMTLAAAWAAVLARLAGQHDVVIGTPSANRSRQEIEPLVGFFVNTLPLRIDLSGEPTVGGLLERVRAAALGAQDHQDVPFEQIVERINPPRQLEHAPLFQVLFDWQNNDPGTLDLPGLLAEPLATPFDRIKFDLELSLGEVGDVIQGHLHYATDLFDAATIARQAGYLMTLLAAMVQADDQPLSRIDLLAPQERQLLLETWNQTAAPYPDDRCLHQLFEEQVQRSPHATALVLDTHTLSYAALNAQANQLAHHLIAQGLRPDGLVALCVQRSFAMVVGLLAILKAGGAYVPLDPDYPAARLQQILDDADPALLLVDAAGRIALGDGALPGRHVLDLDHPHPAWHQQPQTDPDPHALGLHARHLAYVIYTSGSTGTPKGAQNEHRALVNRLVWMQQAYRLDARDVVVQKTPFGFDVSVWEFFWPLLNGATLALAPPGAHKDPDALAALFVHHGVTTAHFVPSMLALFLQTPGVERCTTLRHLVCSGEALPASSVRLAQRRLPWTALHNLYGPTEAAIDVTAWTCPPAFAGESVPIGRPIANTTIYLLDGNGQPVPLGAVGELHIGGVGVARGYLNRPQLTTERFLPDPFAADPEARLYRTGDLARYRADGAIEFLGRIDHQVKLRGFRIELGEIEARIAEHPAVHSTVVLALGEAAHMRLVAYVVPRETPADAPSDAPSDALVTTLRTFLARTLPDYMVPAAFVCLPALPLSANGKLDRKALPAPQDDAFARHAYAPPHPGTEAILAEAWCRLLGRERIGRHDQFFALGGNSLLAVRLLSRIEAACGVRLSLAEVFAHPTLRELAHAVTRHQSGAATASLPAIVPVHHGDTLPLSFAQQRLWFLAQLEGTGTAYHMPGALRLRGDLDPLALRRALDALLQRHAALRTVFATSADGQPLAHLLPAGQAFPLVEHDLGLQPDQAAAIARLALDEVLAPFDLARGPLIRGRLLRLGQADHVLLITQHHIVSDGWSLGILINELGALYRAMVAGQPDPLPPLAVQYPDYAAWQRRWFTAERLGKQLDYWSRCLADAPVLLTLPTDRPRPATPSHAGASVPIALDATLTRALKRLGQQHQTTLFMTLAAAWAAVLARLAGQHDVVIGTPSANRSRQEIEPLVGFFVNTLPLRIDLSGEPTVGGLLERVRAAALGAQDHQDVPFEQIVERINPPRQLEHAPLFQVLFDWQNNDPGTLDLPGLLAEPLATPFDRIKFDLELSLGEVGDVIQGHLHYATDLFDAATIARQAGYLMTQLAAMVQADDQPLSRIDLLAPQERQLLLETWNQTTAPYPDDRCLHQLFEEQVQRSPHATALVLDTHTLSYAALNAQANQLAHHLIAQGLRPDGLVALCVQRSFAMVVGLLAILKAGGAYVPLDPDYPAARLQQILDDADPALLLVDAAGRIALGDGALPGRHVLDLDHPHPAWHQQPQTDPDPHALGLHARHLAYVIYTSGSTGTPKGVMIEHGSVCNQIWALKSLYGLTAHDRLLQFSSPCFDVSVEEIFGALCSGATLVLRTDAWLASASTFNELCTAHGITALSLPTSLWSQWADAWSEARAPRTLRHIVIGGEATSRHALQAWFGDGGVRPTLFNCYGPTETTVNATSQVVRAQDPATLIGRPVANTRVYILDAHGQLVPPGAVGELCIGGVGVARGYLNRPALSAERFLQDPFVADPDARLYRSGDLARHLPDGSIEFLGRNDHQVKLRGFRIELGEIEARLAAHPNVRDNVVLARGEGTDRRLVAYVVPRAHSEPGSNDGTSELIARLRAHLAAGLPDYMVPAAFVILHTLPLTPGGKLDRNALPAPDDGAFARHDYVPPRSQAETLLAGIWQELLALDRVGMHDNFFDVGGTSLHIIALRQKIHDNIGVDISITDLFAHPTIARLSEHISVGIQQPAAVGPTPEQSAASDPGCAIAVIGMAGRFPGASDVATLWANIANGVESLRRFSREELLDAAVEPALLDHPGFVPVRSLLDNVTDFDADYFGFTPREAEVTDPQQRILLECAHEALETAGYGDARSERPVGVFVGVGENQYVLQHLLPQLDAFSALGTSIVHANSKDFAATRISYKLNLSGPAVNVNTACSTSLVAVHLACRSVAQGESRMALAGAAGIAEFGPGGYRYEEGNINSPDGHCRAFDRDARGTRAGNGAGVVLLKRLDHALADNDTIHAVIKGSAVNNDGADKVGYTAPSVIGQARVIQQAQRNADVSPASIGYVEAHGTGTVLGDPIEMRALSHAFAGEPAQRCAIGSVKPNIGHLDTAAGMAGLIKTVEALKHGQLPPSINYLQPNPEIDFAASPFYVNTQLRPWPTQDGPRRAGVSAFGIGGTNAHVVLEEAPPAASDSATRPAQLLLLSARSAEALQAASTRLADYLRSDQAAPLADVAYTLQTGRTAHAWRRAVVCTTAADAATALTSAPAEATNTSDPHASLIWMFPGQGAQHAGMAGELYKTEPVFREQLDVCAEGLRTALGLDLRELLYPPHEAREDANRQLVQTWLAQPALFAVEYSMARLLQSYGLTPDAMIGHSLGEYVAACLAGVFSLQDGLRLVATRGRLMQAMAPGRMLSVREDEERLRARLSDCAVDIAAVNAKGKCTVSGAPAAIAALREKLVAEGIDCRDLETSHAFHSAMMEPMLAAWRKTLSTVSMHAPRLAYVSNLSGGFISAEEATDVEYWVRHLRGTVRFAEGMDVLLSPTSPLRSRCVFVEVGPGQALSGFARQRVHASAHTVVPALGHATTSDHDARSLQRCIGQIWVHGAGVIDWAAYHAPARRRRVPLPTYPFQRRRFWVDAPRHVAQAAPSADARRPHQQDWFYAPLWRLRGSKARPGSAHATHPLTWVVMADRGGIGERLVQQLRHAGQRTITVCNGDLFARLGPDDYAIVADDPRHYGELADHLERDGLRIDRLVHLWSLERCQAQSELRGFDLFLAQQRNGYCSLAFAIAILMARLQADDAAMHVVTHDLFRVTGAELLAPHHAPILGLCKVAPQEHPNLRSRLIDLSDPYTEDRSEGALSAASASLFGELMTERNDSVVAFRNGARWTQTYEPRKVPDERLQPRIKRGGVYVITGGLGKVGYALAEHLSAMSAKLVLIVRDELPPRSLWANWIAERSPSDPVVPKLGRLLALESRGAQVLVCQADVTDEAQMIDAFEQAEIRFGDIDGVIHCAGQVRDSMHSLADTTLERNRAQFLPKVKGTMVLQRVLKHRRVDFCVLMSSLSSVLGGLGFSAYAAANAYMDAFATARHAQGDEAWLSINWDGWHFAGEPAKENAHGVDGREGAQALAYALSWSDVPQLVHSTVDLQARMEKWIDKSPQDAAGMQLYVRGGGTACVAPSTTIEFQLLEIWQQLLGIQDIGVRDAFFDLGGDSLLATLLVARVNKAFNVNLPIRIVFEEETIERIALKIDDLTKRPPQGKPLALKRSGERPPLFCIHPGSGFGRPYMALLRHLPTDLPVYALEARGLNDDDTLPETITDMCADYIEQIQVIQPMGPYHLLGWSFGAIVAHAMSAEMQKRGLAVAKLIMIDGAPLYDEEWPQQAVEEHRLDLESRLSSYRDYQTASEDLKQTMIARMSAIQSNNIRLAYYRDPSPFHGNVLMIIAKDSDRPEKYEFFKKYIRGDVTELKVPYHHNILLTSEALESYAPDICRFLDANTLRHETRLATEA